MNNLGHSDTSLYDFIISGNKGKTAAEKSIIKRILVIKKKCRITDDELKETVNQTGFPEPIPPRLIKLGILIDVLQERYGVRWS